MCRLHLFLSALFFSLAFESHIILLYAQEDADQVFPTTTADVMLPTQDSSVISSNPDTTEEPEKEPENTVAELGTTDTGTKPVTITTSPTQTPVVFMTTPLEVFEPTQTEAQTTVTPSEEPHPSTQSYTVMVTRTQETTPLVSTEEPVPEIITSPEPHDDSTVVTDVITTTPEPTQSPSQAVPTTAPTTVPEPVTELMSSTEQPVETTSSTMTTTPPTTTPTTEPEVDSPDANVTDSTKLYELDTETSIQTTVYANDTIPIVDETSSASEASGEYKGTTSKWLIIIIIAVAIALIVTASCIIIFVKRRKKRGTQHFNQGYMNGRSQKSKKKKGENDAWAGPVNLDGKEDGGENPEDRGQTDDKQADGTEVVLSTFATLDENGGIGRPGSTEVQKWEEKEPLLYIDEDVKEEEKPKPKQKEEAEKTEEVEQKEDEDAKSKTDMKEPNGGEAFCLTTAV